MPIEAFLAIKVKIGFSFFIGIKTVEQVVGGGCHFPGNICCLSLVGNKEADEYSNYTGEFHGAPILTV